MQFSRKIHQNNRLAPPSFGLAPTRLGNPRSANLSVRVAALAGFKSGYIINGEDARIIDWPFIVSVQNLGSGHFCGGVLYESDEVLTAAHCVEGSSP